MTALPDRLDSYRRGIGDCIRVTEAIGRIIATDPEITAGLAELENVNPADAIGDALRVLVRRLRELSAGATDPDGIT